MSEARMPKRLLSDVEELDFDRWSYRLIKNTLLLLAGTLAVFGISIVLLRSRLSAHADVQNVALEIGVNLMLFGVTTLLATVLATQQLEKRLLNSVRGLLRGELGEHMRLQAETVDRLETELRNALRDFNPLVNNCSILGLTNVYLTRADALQDFGIHLMEELRDAKKPRVGPPAPAPAPEAGTRAGREGEGPDQVAAPVRLWIVGSSVKGLVEAATDRFDGRAFLREAANQARLKQIELRILLTHPLFGELRAGQELRDAGAIEQEIGEALQYLKLWGVPHTCIRLVVATPTVFALATRSQMLLNPYPYGAEALRSFSLTVRRAHPVQGDFTFMARDIYEQYLERHFEVPWDGAVRIGEDYKHMTSTGPMRIERTREGILLKQQRAADHKLLLPGEDAQDDAEDDAQDDARLDGQVPAH